MPGLTGAVLGGVSVNVGARVYNNASLLITTTFYTVLTFNSERYDTDEIHSMTTNPGRLTAKTPGVYAMHGQVIWASGSGTRRLLRIRYNGVTPIAEVEDQVVGGGAGTLQLVSCLYYLSANDYIELLVYQNTGGNLNVDVWPNQSPEFAMQLIGPE